MDRFIQFFLAPGGKIDSLALLFIVGSLALLYGLWRVLRDDVDLSTLGDETEPPHHQPRDQNPGTDDGRRGPRRAA